ncbi:hypothetical protein ACQCU1_08110 [Sutcliffiella horikoshii]|uniref:DUF4367 domain-containing protein n=1 Tax=Sutcliffiella horikoshii TaxID=79883 RepID=A0AA94WW40_9BACI|nr:hypothetical protein [Sutcliffiella horikoshii]TYS60946.1 hypothetical protein FZC74_01300 [Sutcliffiella horikoshii]
MRLIVLIALVFILSGCNQEVSQHSIVDSLEGVEEFPYDLKLPTYLPYDVKEVRVYDYIQIIEKLPEKLADAKTNDFTLSVGIGGYSEELIFIEMTPPNNGNSNHSNLEKIVLSGGRVGSYSYANNRQTLSLNDEGMNYNIIVFTHQEGKELYSQEELIKVANSLTLVNR